MIDALSGGEALVEHDEAQQREDDASYQFGEVTRACAESLAQPEPDQHRDEGLSRHNARQQAKWRFQHGKREPEYHR